DAGLILLTGGSAITVGQELSEAEFAALTASADENLSGEFNFTAEAISTEQENNDQETASQVFTVDVAGVADAPTLYVRNVKGTEDVPLLLSDVIQGDLADTDGSEEVWFELTLPEGWSIDAPALQDLGGGVYRVSDVDVQNGATLIPKEDLSQVTEIPSISVQAVSIESPVDGVTPSVVEALSDIRSFTVTLKGVADAPDITTGTGDWSYDPGTGVISSNVTYTEDSLIPPGFGVATEDDDGSEEITLHLSGLPEGSTLFDSSGDEAFLEVFDASDPNNVVYTVTLAQLADLSYKPPQDFSGDVVLNLEQINTEPDGDSAAFNLTIEFTVTPVIDTQDSQILSEQGIEDQPLQLDLEPVLGDLDGSETITSFTFLTGFQGTLFVDGNQIATGTKSGSIDTYAAGDIEGLLRSGRITYLPPEDLAGEFFLDFSYEVTDTNGDPAFDDVKTLSGTVDLTIIAQVEQNQPTTADDTRLEAATTTLISSDGSPIDLSGEVNFFEEDIDGSETLDYVLLKLPTADGWYVTAPGGAIHDGQGNWLIQAPATSDAFKEQNLSILDGVTINNNYNYTGPIEVQARVLDGNGEDADIITATLNVDFQGSPNTIAFDPNDVQNTIIDGIEGEDISFAGHLNTVIRNAGDDSGVDQISIRVTPADMAAAGIGGARITGPGVEVHYDLDGTTVLAWIFDDAALATLGIAGIDEDLSGDVALTIHVVATDPSGDSIEEDQVLNIDILPVVDELNPVDPFQGNEDQLFNLGFDNLNLLGDDDTDPARGTEEITQITFTNLSGGTILDPEGVLIDNGDGSFTLLNADDRNKLFYRPPEHASINDPDPTSSNISLDVTLTITDTTTGGTTQPNSVTTEKTFSLAVELLPITDPANLTVPDTPIIGDEDTHIDLSALTAELIDQDGSEAMSLQIIGGPEGAVMYANGVQLPNNGLDGSGNGTYSWTVTQDQLANLTMVPPQDFAGDITLGLEAVTYEKGTTDFVTTTAEFTVGVNPIADGVQLLNAPTTASTTEGEPVNLNVVAEILEAVNPDEEIELTLTALSTSDTSALARLARIDVGGTLGAFRDNGDGTFSATVRVAATALSVGAGGVDLYTGPLAWGNLDLQLDIRSVDMATVAGSDVEDVSDPVTANLSVTITPEPDPAQLDRLYDGIIASNGQDIDMGVTMTPENPAPGETSQLVIENLPTGFSFNAGSAEGSNWVVDEADIANLQLQTGSATGDFALNLYTRTTLNGETVTGQQQSIEVKIQAAGDNTLEGTSGDDYYSGADGADVFVWSYYDQGSVLFPSNDLVKDFDRAEGDQLNLDSLLVNDTSTTGSDLDALIDVTESGGNTVFDINVNGDAPGNQLITLEGVTKNDLYDGDASVVSEADFLQKLVDDNVMITV
ncbi:type I secretion C-terminal target domain-containing protein, partial [Pseudomaricurvus sp.]|uniref:type I secretion C-terminal target domain-containing protein n=1 Tax=Pseudomaricurvus sp. TaxID=2004510 RepID=UPI003F6C8164